MGLQIITYLFQCQRMIIVFLLNECTHWCVHILKNRLVFVQLTVMGYRKYFTYCFIANIITIVWLVKLSNIIKGEHKQS